ncbi:hypothetical protein CEXT_557171 [Caerostris extrusa]|uniref:C2H2-type domain-containing protein n=1 Tax=Caerostris extrusa TaxID=172846 RepID=A0AAV4XLA6_CAEEX|nr:hypothetical protein CEXT_557171 [Caerostris extrusa]
MGAEGGQNAVRSSENVQKFAEYFLLPPTSNNRNISNTIDSASGCRVRNKKIRTYEMNPNEDSVQLLDLSIGEASYKTDGISGGENCSCQRTQSNTYTSSTECSSSALSSTKNSGDQGRKHACDVCRNELSNLSSLKRHKRAHYGEKQFVCNTCPNRFARQSHLVDHKRHEAIHSRTKPHHCDYCDFENAHKPSLDKHLEAHHSEHKEKCPVCCNYFYSKKSLQSHECKKPQ